MTGTGTLDAMDSMPIVRARQSLHRLLDEIAATGEPIRITGRRADAVLVPADTWRAIRETLYLLSAPGMGESIRAGLRTPIEECLDSVGW